MWIKKIDCHDGFCVSRLCICRANFFNRDMAGCMLRLTTDKLAEINTVADPVCYGAAADSGNGAEATKGAAQLF